nr:hypothetical protein [Actinomycetota bacterium]
MRVIHGIWAHGMLCLWAEDSRLPPAAGSGPGRPGPPRAIQPHPFACPASELADLLAGLDWPGAAAARKAVDAELTLQLPSAGRVPLASPELLPPDPVPAGQVPAGRVPAGRVPAGRVPADRVPAGRVPAGQVPADEVLADEVPAGRARRRPAGRISLASWRVPALAFDPAAALDVLARFSHLDDPAAAAAGSLPYLAAVARFAADLAARGRALPVLAAED